MYFKRWIILWIVIFCQLEGRLGLYSDNDSENTIYQDIPDDGIDFIKDHVLEMTGLPKRPNYKNRKSVPKFLWTIYKHLSEEENSKLMENSVDEIDGITDEHARIIEKSDTIMTFQNNRSEYPNPMHEARLTFDLSSVSLHGVTLLMSEFHIYKWPLPEMRSVSKPCLITVYAPTFIDGAKEMHAIQMVKTTTRYHGWIQMNFTSKLNEWITKKESNNLLYITVEYENELGNWETPNISTNKLLSYSDNEKQPFITAYFANDESYGHVLARKPVKKMTTNRRVRRSTNENSTKKPKNPFSTHQHSNSPKRVVNSKRPCSRYALYITFQELQWDDWIFAPAGYGAYYCQGECKFPFQHHIEATNHAVIQGLVHLLQNSSISNPCCAPSKLQPISLLYMQNETSASIKKYKGMIAAKCACQ